MLRRIIFVIKAFNNAMDEWPVYQIAVMIMLILAVTIEIYGIINGIGLMVIAAVAIIPFAIGSLIDVYKLRTKEIYKEYMKGRHYKLF